MKRIRFNQAIVIILIALSFFFFLLQYLIFKNLNEEMFLLFQDLTFLPIEILLVTFILDRVLRGREKQERLQQVRIVISAFFSEIGTDALTGINETVAGSEHLRDSLDMKASWAAKDFATAATAVKASKLHSEPDPEHLIAMREVLTPKKAYLLQMFSNPNLLEHDTFTDMLWAVYHLIDELESREDFHTLPPSDFKHLGGDITRACGLLALEWVEHMRYLKEQYPYLFSIAVRKNPFAENSIIVKDQHLIIQ